MTNLDGLNDKYRTYRATEVNRPKPDILNIYLGQELMQLNDRLEAVVDEATFLDFVRALTTDRLENAEAWDSGTIEDFLEAASSWADDSGFGSRQGLSSASPWKKFAVFLYCGKIYE